MSPVRALAGALADEPANDNHDPEVLGADEVAALLGVNRKTVYEAASRGEIPCRRLGRRMLFYRPALVSWLQGCKATSCRSTGG